jgi:serpin B
MGITDIFDPEISDFTPLTDSTDEIYLSKAEQNTRVLIDEEGCKAASVTVMMYDGWGASTEQENFILDRPFIFEIMSETGLPLFVGIVNNPA